MSGESPRQLDFRVAGALVGQRLDKALCGLLPDLSRAAVQRAISAGACRIDGLPVSTASLKLKAGQEVRLDLPDTANELRAEDEAVDILWQDEHLLLCNKPAGLTVHPCPSCPENTLVQRLLHHFPRLREQEGLRPGVVHRLDKDTSGLLLVALDEPTRLRMSEAFARREVHKEYLALVQGVPPQTGTCREPLGRHPTAKVKMAVVPENRGGKAAHSDWRVLWSSPRKDFSLVAVRIHTGRTHQIRVHMAHVGHPLLGDALYAPAPVAARAPRQMLHAWHISFCHPLSGEALVFFCPPPDDMLRTILNNSSRMQRLVITGNPGCGKSTLTHALEEAGLPTVSADALVAQLYAAGGEMADYLGRLCVPPTEITGHEDELRKLNKDQIKERLLNISLELYRKREEQLTAYGHDMRELERAFLLHSVDRRWMDHIDAMDQLRDGIGLRAFAQRDPINEYKMESYDMFEDMVRLIREDTVRLLFLAHIEDRNAQRRRAVAAITGTNDVKNSSAMEKAAKSSRQEGARPVKADKKPGRNDPCPCGKMKADGSRRLKYKECCGRND